jgi:hypothetical protein
MQHFYGDDEPFIHLDTSTGPTKKFFGSATDEEMLARGAQVLSKFATTLLLKKVDCTVTSAVPSHKGLRSFTTTAPSWSDEKSIYLNPMVINNLDKTSSIIALRGLGLHEAAHIQFTPRKETKLVREIANAELYRSFNALEDARIEMAYYVQYSNVADWMTGAVLEHALKLSPAELQFQLPLIWGRKYLHNDIRQHFYDIFPLADIRDELCALIDEYIRLDVLDSKNYTRAFEIIHRFDELIKNGAATRPAGCITLPTPEGGMDTFEVPGSEDGWDVVNDGGHSDAHSNGYGKSDSDYSDGISGSGNKKTRKRIVDKITKVADDADNPDPQPTPPSDGQGNPSNQPGSPSNQPGSPDSSKTTPPSSDDSNSNGVSDSGTSKSFTQMAKDALDKIAKDNNKTIDTVRSQLNGRLSLDGKTVPQPKTAIHGDRTPSPASVAAVKQFGDELLELKSLYDPAWNRKVDTGKLNVQRYALGADVEESFDQWDTGREDAVDIECVIALDVSGSMTGVINKAFESMWVVKRAMDKVGASTTVVTYDSVTKTLYSADSLAGASYRVGDWGGGTDPLYAVEYAQSVLSNSERAVKVFIPITDGDWYNDREADEIIKRMRNSGVITALAYIADGNPTTNVNSHNCEAAAVINNVSQLSTLARAMVRLGIDRNLNN